MSHCFGRYALYVLTPQGLALCRKLAGRIEADVFVLRQVLETQAESGFGFFPQPDSGLRFVAFDSLRDAVREAFSHYSCHLFITATGIAVRMIAPLIAHKATDPAVLVTDQQGRFVISLLSGHLGGANAEARCFAQLLGAQPVITTATDSEGLPSIDLLAAGAGLHIVSLDACKQVSAALLRREPVFLYDPCNALGLDNTFWSDADVAHGLDDSLQWGDAYGLTGVAGAVPVRRSSIFTPVKDMDEALRVAQAKACVIVNEYIPEHGAYDTLCWLHPKNLYVGIGLRRGASADAVLDALTTCLAQSRLSMHSISALASVDIKADEPGLCAVAETLGIPLAFYSSSELAQFPCTLPSPKVMEVLGIPGVCENAALAAAKYFTAPVRAASRLSGEGAYRAELLLPKQIHGPVTIAVARRHASP
ncbi:cobalamin biosynthesis protein [Desulfovibrio sp. OttesenSCG-928-G15]|nr:cobalamin biosynthesis protein [Desulfovibrio sp. OttesenSCG-928-G15]